jgi:cytochrome c
MDSMEVNKAIAAVLVAGIAFSVSGLVGQALVHVKPLKESAIQIDVPEPAGAKDAAPEALPPIGQMMAVADPGAGEAVTKKICAACHSFTEGGKAGVGPNLYGVVGAPHGSKEGFNYSNAIKTKEGPWTFAELNEWLHKPAAYAPGTRMAFAGLSNAKDRANVIDYLRTLSGSPQPRPTPEPAAAALAPAAPGAAPAAGNAPSEIGPLLAKADPAKGQANTTRYACAACHSFTEGGKSGIGPNLYNIVGAPHAHMQGFAYSEALKKVPGDWTYEDLNRWLAKPATYAPGTKMAFPGIPDPVARADVIAYLRSLSTSPKPLP